MEISPDRQVLAYVVYGGFGVVLHFGRHRIDWVVSQSMLVFAAIGWFVGFWVASYYAMLAFRDFVALVALYAIYLFILISELMTHGLSGRLTKWRGEKWTKELDYFYIALGGIGLVASINRMNIISDKVDFSDVYGPLVIATALVLRAIKTRAEINNWNKVASPPQ